MAWQVLAIWIIVIPVVVSFLRSEADMRQARARARHWHAASRPNRANRPQLTPQPAVAMAQPALRTGGLTQSQRAFLNAMVKAD